MCVVSLGLHDMAIPNMTLSLMLENAQWWLSQLHSVCAHIVWLGCTRVLSGDYAQTTERMYEWNKAMEKVLHEQYASHATFWDVFDQSLSWEMLDNVHMLVSWYQTLGSTFLKLIDKLLNGTKAVANETAIPVDVSVQRSML
jgi:hypothetical protein